MKSFIITLLLAFFCASCADTELQDKAEFSGLQYAELKGRGLSITGFTLITIEDLKIVGFPADDAQGNVWVLLNPQSSPYYKQIPRIQFTISKSVLEQIEATHYATETVLAVLETHVGTEAVCGEKWRLGSRREK